MKNKDNLEGYIGLIAYLSALIEKLKNGEIIDEIDFTMDIETRSVPSNDGISVGIMPTGWKTVTLRYKEK